MGRSKDNQKNKIENNIFKTTSSIPWNCWLTVADDAI